LFGAKVTKYWLLAELLLSLFLLADLKRVVLQETQTIQLQIVYFLLWNFRQIIRKKK
jgi:hypothetical protein